MERKQAFVTTRTAAEALKVVGTDVSFLCPAARTGQSWSLMEVALPRHAGPPPHHHPWDEAYYVIEGEVDFSLDGALRHVGAGEFVYAPGGTVHGFTGASDLPARVLILDVPAHSEAFFREIDREVKGPDDMAKLAGIGERHQVHFL
jgi:quercetin dioxygenase-like cupin family protein